MQLIGLSGAARSGKDTVGEFLETQFDFKRYAFADPLKRAAHEMFGIPLIEFYEGDREIVNEFWGFSPREILQLIGTECGRQVFRNDIWVKRAEMEWNNHQQYVNNVLPETFGTVEGFRGMVITDVRFENEAKFIREMGGTVLHVERPGFVGEVGVANHASEAGYSDDLKDHIVVNDGTLEQLYTKVENIFFPVYAEEV